MAVKYRHLSGNYGTDDIGVAQWLCVWRSASRWRVNGSAMGAATALIKSMTALTRTGKPYTGVFTQGRHRVIFWQTVSSFRFHRENLRWKHSARWKQNSRWPVSELRAFRAQRCYPDKRHRNGCSTFGDSLTLSVPHEL